jgi:hypothetical protein
MRGGVLNDPKFGSRMSGEGIFSEQIQGLFAMACKKSGVNREEISLSTGHFRNPSDLPTFGPVGPKTGWIDRGQIVPRKRSKDRTGAQLSLFK